MFLLHEKTSSELFTASRVNLTSSPKFLDQFIYYKENLVIKMPSKVEQRPVEQNK